MRRFIVLFSLGLAVSALPAQAQQATGTNTVGSTLQVSATVTKAIRLTLTTDTECAISTGSGTDYTMNFGTVDALGISAGACGTRFAPTTPGSTAAVYSSAYKLKPSFSSQSTSNNIITAYVSTDFASASGLLTVVQASTAPSAVGDFSSMSKVPGTPTTIASNVSNNADISRYIGVAVAPINGSGTLSGADAATITYTLTVQ